MFHDELCGANLPTVAEKHYLNRSKIASVICTVLAAPCEIAFDPPDSRIMS